MRLAGPLAIAAGAVDENVDPAELRRNRRAGLHYVRFDADIDRQSDGLMAVGFQALDGRRRPVRMPVEDADARATRSKRLYGCRRSALPGNREERMVCS